VLINTRLLALCTAHDSVAADTEKLEAAAEVYRDLLSSVRTALGCAAAGTIVEPTHQLAGTSKAWQDRGVGRCRILGLLQQLAALSPATGLQHKQIILGPCGQMPANKLFIQADAGLHTRTLIWL